MSTLKNITAALALAVIFTNITQGQSVKQNFSTNHEEPLSVKYMGNDGEYLSFTVTVQPQAAGNAFLAIADKNEGELFSTNLPKDLNVKTIKIEKKDDQVLNFKLVIGKKVYSKSFSVNTTKVETTTVAENDIARF